MGTKRGFMSGLGRATGEFFKGIWSGMGPDPRKRTIKTRKKDGTIPIRDIRRAVRKSPPKRIEGGR